MIGNRAYDTEFIGMVGGDSDCCGECIGKHSRVWARVDRKINSGVFFDDRLTKAFILFFFSSASSFLSEERASLVSSRNRFARSQNPFEILDIPVHHKRTPNIPKVETS